MLNNAPAYSPETGDRVKVQLDDCGVFVSATRSAPIEAFYDTCKRLGNIARTDNIMIVEHATNYSLQAGSLQLHTDHPLVDYIGWYCVVQDEIDGTMLFVDGLSAIEDSFSPDEIDDLHHIEILHPPIGPTAKKGFWPVVKSESKRSLYYVPWLPARGPSASANILLDRLKLALERCRASKNIGVRLLPGQFVIIHNKRMLHGRDAIAADSKRRLLRVWIRAAH